MDNSLKYPVEVSPEENIVNKNAYVIRVKLANEFGEWNYSSVLKKMNSLSSTASATSCGTIYTYFYNAYPAKIHIEANADFNKHHPSGTSLNDLFVCVPGDSKEQYSYPSHAMSIDNLISSMKKDMDIYYEYIDFYLKYSPENIGTYTFSVIMTMSNEDVFIERITVDLK